MYQIISTIGNQLFYRGLYKRLIDAEAERQQLEKTHPEETHKLYKLKEL